VGIIEGAGVGVGVGDAEGVVVGARVETHALSLLSLVFRNS
jgi:hypothetical protein